MFSDFFKYNNRLIYNVFYFLEITFRFFWLCFKLKPRVIHCHDTMVLFSGVLYKLFFNSVYLIYDAHELETETFVIKGIRKTLSKIVERICIRYVDLTLVVSESIEDWYIEKYKLKNIITIKNSPHFGMPPNSDIIRKKLKLENHIKIILYLGGLMSGRGIEDAIDAFSLLKRKDYCLVFLGYGDLENYILEKAKRKENIFHMAAVPPNEVLTYACSADIGIAFIDNGSLNDHYCLPNKFFEYIFSGLPVIVSEAPEMAKIVRKFGIGDVIKKLDYKSLELSLSKIEMFNKSTLALSLKTAAFELSWENQEIMLLNSHRDLLTKKRK